MTTDQIIGYSKKPGPKDLFVLHPVSLNRFEATGTGLNLMESPNALKILNVFTQSSRFDVL